MRIISVSNQKGGVGKTASVMALGEALSKKHKTLLIDLDPQMSMTEVYELEGSGMSEVLGGENEGVKSIYSIAQQVGDNLWLAPSDSDLGNTQRGLLARKIGREHQLKKSLEREADAYDLVLIDTPPGMGMLSLNSLVASEGIMVPTQPSAADLRGLKLFLATIEQVREYFNPDIGLMGIFLTFFEDRLLLHQEALKLIKAAGYPLFKTRIGRSVRVSEGMGQKQSVVSYEPKNKVAQQYQSLAKEVNKWLTK